MIRERLYQQEEETLSPFAMLCKNTRGREIPIEESEIRTEYMRDQGSDCALQILPAAQGQDPGIH